MSRVFYLLRHGQTELNSERRMQGQCDSALTELGRAQARAMGVTLRAEITNPANWVVLASPLGRAMQTARLVCSELGLTPEQIRSEPRLIEVAFGAWEMQQVDELHAKWPELASRSDWHFQAPGCEPYSAVLERIEGWLADEALPERMIVVAHGLLGRILRGVYAGLSAAEIGLQDMPQDAFFKLQNGQLSRIQCVQTEPVGA